MADTDEILEAVADLCREVTVDDWRGNSFTLSKVAIDDLGEDVDSEGKSSPTTVDEPFAFIGIDDIEPRQETGQLLEIVSIGVTMFGSRFDGKTRARSRISFARRMRDELIALVNSQTHMSLGGVVMHCWVSDVGGASTLELGNVEWSAAALTLSASVLSDYGA